MLVINKSKHAYSTLRRQAIKRRIMEAMGGKCVCCGYNKHFSALAYHHVNPSEKEIDFRHLRSSFGPKALNALISELRKCVLVCHNCHAEIHSGITSIPTDCYQFDEIAFLQSSNIENIRYEDTSQSNLDDCPVCGNKKTKGQIVCSRKCADSRRVMVKWKNVDLAKELETKTIHQVAKELKCSYTTVYKRAKKLGLVFSNLKDDS
jgi:hypothetical protein